MVIKVGTVRNITFKNTPQNNVINSDNNDESKNIKELSYVTPDFAVKIPQKYTGLGVSNLTNGLKLHSYKLSNGYRVSIVPMEGSPVVVKNYVNVGSLNETDDIKGISHFLEHMAFNGTNGSDGYLKLNTGDSFKKIDKLGGWANASTNYAVTDYVNSTPALEKSDIEEQIKVIAAMTEDLALSNDMIEKEKGPVCSEINMILDNPRTVLMDQTMRTLFNIKSSADELVGGSVKHIKNLTREQVKDYYEKYYTPQNMNLVITGDVNPEETIELVSKCFKSKNNKPVNFYKENLTPLNKTTRKDFTSSKATSTGIMLGFIGPQNNNFKEDILFDITYEYLNSFELGLNKDLKRMNAPANFGKERIGTAPNDKTIMYCELECAENNTEKVLQLLFQKISEMKSPDELENIKEKIIQKLQNNFCYSANVNDVIGNAVLDGRINSLPEAELIINSITPDDVEKFIKKYFDLNKVAITVVHPEVKQNASINFKSSRIPTKIENINVETLDNNIEVAFQKTKNENICFDLNLYYAPSSDIKPATRQLLDIIYSMGTANTTEDGYNRYLQENNINISTKLCSDCLNITGYSGSNNSQPAISKAIELLKTPAITEENLKTAKSVLRDYLNRHTDTAETLYIKNQAAVNPLYSSKDQVEKDLDSITLEDIQNAHKYILENSRGTFAMNTPESKTNLREQTVDILKTIPSLKANIPVSNKVYCKNKKTEVITKSRDVSQADINETFKFQIDSSARESAILSIISSILSNSSIGLFDNLREKENLAYSVRAEGSKIGDCGELTLKILTTTENKDIGEISYENIEKSINGFNRQINALLNSEYTDEDLENAKKLLKATLLNLEGIPCKVNSLSRGLNSNDSIERDNNIYKEIDSITRDDIDTYTKKIFQNPPIYTIVASENSLNANQKYLDGLKKDSDEIF